jgi:hypothetical protein
MGYIVYDGSYLRAAIAEHLHYWFWDFNLLRNNRCQLLLQLLAFPKTSSCLWNQLHLSILEGCECIGVPPASLRFVEEVRMGPAPAGISYTRFKLFV